MKEKLTLSIDKSTIAKSKKYARLYNKSISSLVENYLESLTDDELDWKPQKNSVVKKMSGSVIWPYRNEKSYNDLLEQELLEKYGIQENSD